MAVALGRMLDRAGECDCCVYAAYAGGDLLPDAREFSRRVQVLVDSDRYSRRLRGFRASVRRRLHLASGRPRPESATPSTRKTVARFLRDLVATPRLAWCLRRDGIQALNAHQTSTTLLAVLGAALAGCPVVITIHSAPEVRGTSLEQALVGWAIRRTAAVITVSRGSRSSLISSLGLEPGRVHLVPNGIPAPLGGPKTLAALTFGIGCAGNMTTVKQHEIIVRAMPQILEREPQARLFLAGDGPLRRSLEATAHSLKISAAVEFLGAYSGPADPLYQRFLRSIDVLVVPSLTEACPLVAIEAMASAIPVVARHVGGLSEMIDHGRTGLLVDASDSRAFADAVTSLLGDEDAWRAMAVASAESYVARYTPDRMRDSTREVFADVLRQQRIWPWAGSRRPDA